MKKEWEDNMKIGIITYNIPHRKTQDLVFRLKSLEYKNLYFIITPFIERPTLKPVFNHRPKVTLHLDHTKFAQRFNIKLIPIESLYKYKEELDYILIGGAGIIEEHIINDFTVINSHPGYLPNVRGLDALKWAIYEGQPIGVTTHIIDKEPDTGKLINRMVIPVYFEDNITDVAVRLYEQEIILLSESIERVRLMSYDKPKADFENLKDMRYKEIHKRMPTYLEHIMLNRFEERRKKSPSKYMGE